LKLLTTSILTGILFTSQSADAAKYKMTEITPLDDFRNHIARDISDNGQVVGVVQEKFSTNYYLEQYLLVITASSIPCSVSEDELNSGQFDNVSDACVHAALEEKVNDERYQKVSDTRAFISSENQAQLTNLVDVFDAELGDYTFSNIEQLLAINSQGIAVGVAEAPYSPVMFLQTGEDAVLEEEIRLWQREYSSRAVISLNGEVRTIEPEFNLYGGKTAASDISNSGYVSGTTSVAIIETTQELIERDCNGELLPENICIWTKDNGSNLYTERPVIWKVDVDGNLESTQVYDLPFTPAEDDTLNYGVIMSAVNDSGVGVGHGNLVFEERYYSSQPVLFKDGQSTSFIDPTEYYEGFSFDINDEGLVVGRIRNVDGSKAKFFIYDSTTEQLTTPETFYQNSESSAYSINNSGKVVGDAEFEVTTNYNRRKHGFLYDSVSKQFFDLNNLVECNSGYDIVKGVAINNNDVITATALKTVDKRDLLGEVVLDANGEAVKEQVQVSIVMEPINGEVETCTEDNDPPSERKGLTTSLAMSFSALLLSLFRRKRLLK
jgi:uncharacterized membrane protein